MSAAPHTAIERLLAQAGFDSPGPAAEFVPAVNACCSQLTRQFPQYARFLSERSDRGADPTWDSLDQLDELPPLFLPVLKRFQFTLPADMDVRVALTSSGTTGRPSSVPLDAVNLERRVTAMSTAYRDMGILTGPTSALAFLLDPRSTNMAGSVIIDGVLRTHPHVSSVDYLARLTESGPEFDCREATQLVAAAAERGPLLIVGYPSLIAAAIGQMQDNGTQRLPLPDDSLILTGGGWKSTLPGVRLDQAEFRQMAADFFCISPAAIRDMFGLSECPAVFLQCTAGNYHVPASTWVQAVDPESQTEVPDGQVGLLQITTPLTTSYPLLRILTTDKISLNRDCSCGLPSPCFQPHGRVSAARFETCAMRVGQAVS